MDFKILLHVQPWVRIRKSGKECNDELLTFYIQILFSQKKNIQILYARRAVHDYFIPLTKSKTQTHVMFLFQLFICFALFYISFLFIHVFLLSFQPSVSLSFQFVSIEDKVQEKYGGVSSS